MKDINNKLDGLSELVTRIDAKILDINTKLDELIKALHEYDGDEEYGESSFEAFQDEALEKAAAKYSEIDILKWNVDGAERIPPCIGHDKASWDEIEANKRMDVIGQNGNTGEHYTDIDENEFNDYGERIVKDKDKSNNSDKYTVVEKKRNNGRESGLKAMGEGQPKQKRYWKNNRSKRNDNKK